MRFRAFCYVTVLIITLEIIQIVNEVLMSNLNYSILPILLMGIIVLVSVSRVCRIMPYELEASSHTSKKNHADGETRTL